MSGSSKGPLTLSILIITVGVVGILTFILSGGFDKFSAVVGPFFLVSSILSILRQTGHLAADTEVPVLVIAVGALMLVAQMRWVPVPGWLVPLQAPGHEPERSA
jgi:hypothetical protein